MPKRRILAVMSGYGYWGIELVGPLRKLESAGYAVDFVTPKGERSPCLPPSRDTAYVDPPLGVCVTTPEDKELVDAFEATDALDATMNLSEMFPERRYHSAPDFLRALED
jgi:putative intracellular protease/amidase